MVFIHVCVHVHTARLDKGSDNYNFIFMCQNLFNNSCKFTPCNIGTCACIYNYILDIRISTDASRRMYYFLMTIIITSAIQGINGASLKEHWAAQRNHVYKQQYQRLQHDTGLKYEMEFFLSSVQS